jgi:glycosyltransferase involved in cell wall biosynthesis
VSQPLVSVVIPTTGRRPERLRQALETIAGQELPGAQGLPAGAVEVVVAGDAGTPEPGFGARLVLADRASGTARKRNLGWHSSHGRLIAFTDDDCRPSPGWLAALLAAADATPGAFVQGRTEPHPDQERLVWGLAHYQRIVGDSPWHETCNIAYPRELLEKLGGFDEAFAAGGLGGEDTDLGLRALAAGAPKVYADDALVWHAVERRTPGRILRDGTRWGDLPLVFARHPEARSALYGGLFLREGHARFLLAAAGLATRRPLVAALATAPYVEFHLRSYRRSPLSMARGLAQLPLRAAADAIAVGTMLRGSLRHRTLVL